MSDLIIKNVDLELLKKQRKSLTRAINQFTIPTCLESNLTMVNDLIGLRIILDTESWSDEKFFEEVKNATVSNLAID